MDGIKPELATHKWLLDHAEHKADACLTWPWFRDPDTGYGRVTHKRKVRYAHRLMCELAKGPPPTPKHQASHSCNNGKSGCVNPRHLSWKTNKENQLDREAHGTMRKKGSRRFVLTPEAVAQIRSIGDKETKTALAKRFGTSRDTIAKILDGRAWKRPGEFDTGARPAGDPRNAALHRKTLAEYALDHLREAGVNSIRANDRDLCRAIMVRAGREFRGENSIRRLAATLASSPLFGIKYMPWPGLSRKIRRFEIAAYQQSTPDK